MSVAEPQQDTSPRRRRSRSVIFGALAVAAVGVAVVLVLLIAGGDDEEEAGQPGLAREVSVEDLREFARDRGNPVFWAGQIEGMKLEFTETARGHVFVRYLPDLAPIGDGKQLYTTVATYPQPDAVKAVREAGEGEGNVTREVRGGGVATWDRSRPNSVYLGLPGIDFLVEVFHPRASIAQNLALSGRIRPAG